MAGLLERRHTLRRALGGGVVLGVAAGLVVGAVEVAYVLATAGASFDGTLETGRFVALTLATLAGAGALLGCAQGLVAAAVAYASAALGESRRDQVWQARLYTALAVPPVALVCAQIFRGPHARTIPHHDLYAVAIGVAALVVFWVALRAWQRLYGGSLAPGAAWLAGAVLIAAAVLSYSVDQRVLVRLYPFFHAGLGIMAFAAAELAIAVVTLAARRKHVRLLEPRNAALVGLLAVAVGAASLHAIGSRRALRTVVLERTVLAAPVLRALGRAPAPPRASGSGPAVAAVTLPEGPHLGPLDVFLITVDAMRADRLTARTAPTLSALADSGVVFDRAYAQVPHTSFSLATLLTGKHVFALSTLGLDTASHQTLPEVLKRERYKTAAFYPPSVFTIDRDRLRSMEESRYGFEYVKYEHLDAARRTDQVIHFLEMEKPARAFVWVHYFEPHEPYEAHPGHFDGARTSIEKYDGEVHYVDAEVARLVEYLKKTRPHALVIVAADHGEEFGEHGGRYHGTTLYEEQVHVPLAFATLDGAGLQPHHVIMPVGLVDVAPTILSLIGIVPSARMRGHDLGPWLLSKPAPDDARGPVFAEIDRQKMIVDGQHKLVCDFATDACNAFDLAADPEERKNRIDDPFAGKLRARLDAWMTEESRFESQGSDPRVQKILDRARMGDGAVAHELPPLLADPSLNREVAHLLAVLPPDRANLRQPMKGLDPVAADWLRVAGARLGEAEAVAELRRELPRLCAPDADAELCARAALASDDGPSLIAAIDYGRADKLDEPLQRALIAGVGKSHDPHALDALMVALANVRTRLDCVNALATLDDSRALPTLLLWLPNEPYVPVRAMMALLVAQLARNSAPAKERAGAVLSSLAQTEREPPVMAALLAALRGLSPAVVDVTHAPIRTIAGGELWIAGNGDGTVEIGPLRATMKDGVARVDTPRALTASVRKKDGDAEPRVAFSRPKP